MKTTIATMSFSINDLAGFSTGGAENQVSAIAGLLDGVKTEVADAADTTIDADVLTYAALPNNDAVDAVPNAVRYLAARKSKLVATLLDHVSTDDGGLPAQTLGAPDTGESFESAINTYAEENNKWIWDENTNPKSQFACTGNFVTNNNAIACAYDETSDFLLREANLDKAKGVYFGTNLGALDETQIANLDLTTLFALLGAHGEFYDLTEDTSGHITVFAPNENAFGQLSDAQKAWLTWNKPVTQLVLKNHILAEGIPSWSEDVDANAPNDQDTFKLSPIGGDDITVTNDSGFKFALDDAAFTAAGVNYDYYFRNAVVHVIDKVLLKTGQVGTVDTALGYDTLGDALDTTDFATLLDLVGKASKGISDALGEDYTLLAPTEKAFADLTPEQVAYLVDEENQEDLDTVLKAHVLTSRYFGSGVSPEASGDITDANGNTITCTGVNCSGGAGDVPFELKEQRYSKNGVLYTIDSVIVPPGTNIPAPSNASSMTLSAAVTAFAALAASFFF